jgi:hypothetical protein
MSQLKGKRKVLTGQEEFYVADINGVTYVSRAQEVADLAPAGFSPVDGEGTTVSGSAIDLGGTISTNILLDVGTSNRIDIGSGTNYTRFNFNIQQDGFQLDSEDYQGNGYYAVIGGNTGLNSSSAYIGVRDNNTFNDLDINISTNLGMVFRDEIGVGLFMPDIPSGATQVAAGAVANQLWVTASHATLPDGVVMRGV